MPHKSRTPTKHLAPCRCPSHRHTLLPMLTNHRLPQTILSKQRHRQPSATYYSTPHGYSPPKSTDHLAPITPADHLPAQQSPEEIPPPSTFSPPTSTTPRPKTKQPYVPATGIAWLLCVMRLKPYGRDQGSVHESAAAVPQRPIVILGHFA